jgi:chemotaxis protein methyltransferase CheR
MDPVEVLDSDLGSLLDTIFVRYGYDFREYARGTLTRRVRRAVSDEGLATLAELQERLLDDPVSFQRFLGTVSVSATDMFRDPACFLAFRREVVPFLRTYPHLKIWIAGCATGEEAYSVAILLREEGLEERTLIYATDMNPTALERARAGIYPAVRLGEWAEYHRQAGGVCPLVEYFKEIHRHAAIQASLRQRIHFTEHNLVADQVFGEMNVILCRNVLIYFERSLQNRAVALLGKSLAEGGFLCLGAKESLRLTEHARAFEEVVPGSKIFRKRIHATR